MSQTNPRKAALRPPTNGSGGNESPNPDGHPAPSTPTFVASHHPLPQRPHTHIPSHLRPHRGGGRPNTSKPSAPVVEESQEMKALREKFGAKMETLKEIYSTWSDEDLLSLLAEVNGNVETAVGRIAEGRAEQWGSVSHKKDKKERTTSISGQQVPSRDGAASPGLGGRGGFRGGRGGFAGARGGARGGRGGGGSGFSSGSPSTPKPATNGDSAAWGKVPLTAGHKGEAPATETNGDAVANDAGGWGTVTAADSGWGTVNGGGGWGDAEAKPTLAPTEPLKSVSPAPPPAVAATGKPKSPASKSAAKPQPPAGVKTWAQIAKPKPKPAAPAPVPSSTTHAPPSAPAPSTEPSTVNSAPDFHPDTSEPDAAEDHEDGQAAAVEPASEDSQEPTSHSASAWSSHEEEATTAPLDDWIAVTPQNHAAVELPPTTAETAQEEPHVEAPIDVHVEPPASHSPSASVSQPAADTLASSQVTSPSHPPGLSAIPSSAPTPSLSTTSSATAATTAPSVASSAKPQTPRMAHRASAKYKTTDAPVVMPGGGVPATNLGGLSFGNAISGFDSSSSSRFGMQFGSLSLNDDLDMDAPLEPPEPVPEPEEPVVPIVQHEPVAVPTSQQPVIQPEPTPSPAQHHVQQSQQPMSGLNQHVLEQQQPAPPQQAQRSPHAGTNGTTLSAINNLFQQAQQQQQVQQQQQAQQLPPIQTQQQHPSSLPHQVTSSSSSSVLPGSQQQMSGSAPSPVSSLPSFVGASGLHHHLQQQQQQQLQNHQQQQPSLQSHTSQFQQHQSQLGQPLQAQQHGLGGASALGVAQQGQQQQAQAQQQQHLPYSSHLQQQQPQQQQQQQSQLPPHLGGVGAEHPAIAAQSAYFRGSEAASPYGGFHAPTPPQTGLPQQLQQDHASSYGAFTPVGAGGGQQQQQPQLQQQGSHLGGFGTSPAAGDYGAYDAQSRGFYDSYSQGSAFQSRNQLGHEDPAKPVLPPSNLSNTLPGPQAAQTQAGSQNAVSGQQGGQFGMMPYYHYQQPYYHPVPTHQYNPYGNQNPYAKYPPFTQPPSVPGAPPPQQQQGTKPPVAAAAASPYGSQSHLHYPSQNSPYDDPSPGGYQPTTSGGSDYGKQQPLYGQGISNFYGAQNPAVQNGPQLGTGQAARSAAGGVSTSPENPYKPYNGPGVGTDKAGQQQGQQGRGAAGVQGGAQPQQGGYYPNRYSNQPQPATQGYPQTDGQFYPSYQQPRQYWS